MPEICRFYGIVITMNFSEHGPPHFHARYSGDNALVNIESLSMEGRLPPRARGLVVEWATLHQDELLAAWDRAQRQEQPGRIDPLS